MWLETAAKNWHPSGVRGVAQHVGLLDPHEDEPGQTACIPAAWQVSRTVSVVICNPLEASTLQQLKLPEVNSFTSAEIKEILSKIGKTKSFRDEAPIFMKFETEAVGAMLMNAHGYL